MEKTVTTFSPVWWDEFLDTTGKMSRTSVMKDCMTKDETALMRTYILEILADLARMRTDKHGYRVYIEGKQLEKNEMFRIYDHPPLPGETVESWVERTFGDKKFGMIINEGERFNMELSRRIALKLAPLLEKTGMPTEGIIFTLFIGNYDSTPLGIHLDLPGKSVIHFHLGPGSKTMYTWDNAEYEALVGEEKYNNKAISKYTPYANKFPFDEGDIYFMPENTYHVGTQEGLSIAIACWCFNRANYDFAGRLQTIIKEQYLQKSTLMLKPDTNPLDNTGGVDKTLDLYKLPPELEDLSFKDLLRATYKDLRYGLFSNAGYRTYPFPKTDNRTLLVTDTIEVEKPYKIQYYQASSKLYIFVRGVKTEFKYFSCIENLIDTINEGKPLLVSDLLAVLPDWDESIGLYILGLLYKHHGIRVL
ncbi:hypothetical protein SAMN04488505_105189 [Chitinophaga rupis]|uniref:JmjC domain-containing protein n=1 Tax=Chitinophaga rupis TaxID=573321 RepID=A0A1H7ZSX5_9BACT|nr:hypothetical protein [Chitinophaga rupis]SEM61393.1 hypothetical protein SAMN04488505_105189 [Chitinophaga rupis]